MNLLPALRRVDRDSPACREVAKNRWAVEPGDATHYEVIIAKEFGNYMAVMAYVGCAPDQGLMVIHYNAVNSKEIRFGQPSSYTLKVLRYFADLAYGDNFGEPEGLTERRKMHELRSRTQGPSDEGVVPA